MGIIAGVRYQHCLWMLKNQFIDNGIFGHLLWFQSSYFQWPFTDGSPDLFKIETLNLKILSAGERKQLLRKIPN